MWRRFDLKDKMSAKFPYLLLGLFSFVTLSCSNGKKSYVPDQEQLPQSPSLTVFCESPSVRIGETFPLVVDIPKGYSDLSWEFERGEGAVSFNQADSTFLCRLDVKGENSIRFTADSREEADPLEASLNLICLAPFSLKIVVESISSDGFEEYAFKCFAVINSEVKDDTKFFTYLKFDMDTLLLPQAREEYYFALWGENLSSHQLLFPLAPSEKNATLSVQAFSKAIKSITLVSLSDDYVVCDKLTSAMKKSGLSCETFYGRSPLDPQTVFVDHAISPSSSPVFSTGKETEFDLLIPEGVGYSSTNTKIVSLTNCTARVLSSTRLAVTPQENGLIAFDVQCGNAVHQFSFFSL